MVEKTFEIEKLKIQDMRKIPNFRTFEHSKDHPIYSIKNS